MPQKPLPKCSWHTMLVVMLSVLVALSMSQAVVVCVGADGHVALETAGHHHCDHDTHADNANGSAAEKEDHCHAEGTPCQPCTDIPVCAGALEHLFKPSYSPAGIIVPAACIVPFGFAAQDATGGANLESFTPFATFFVPLRTVILQV